MPGSHIYQMLPIEPLKNLFCQFFGKMTVFWQISELWKTGPKLNRNIIQLWKGQLISWGDFEIFNWKYFKKYISKFVNCFANSFNTTWHCRWRKVIFQVENRKHFFAIMYDTWMVKSDKYRNICLLVQNFI